MRTMAFDLTRVSSASRLPCPPAIIATFISAYRVGSPYSTTTTHPPRSDTGQSHGHCQDDLLTCVTSHPAQHQLFQ
jgi:hypothetical protein